MSTQQNPAALDNIIEQAREDLKFSLDKSWEVFRVITDVEGQQLVVSEGATSKKLAIPVANFMSLGMHYPEYLLKQLRGNYDVPEFRGTDRIPRVSEVHHDRWEWDGYPGIRNGYVKWLAEAANHLDPTHDRGWERYDYQLFKVLVETSSELNIGTNPFGTHTYFAKGKAIRITKESETETEDDEPDVETTSAAEVDW